MLSVNCWLLDPPQLLIKFSARKKAPAKTVVFGVEKSNLMALSIILGLASLLLGWTREQLPFILTLGQGNCCCWACSQQSKQELKPVLGRQPSKSYKPTGVHAGFNLVLQLPAVLSMYLVGAGLALLVCTRSFFFLQHTVHLQSFQYLTMKDNFVTSKTLDDRQVQELKLNKLWVFLSILL